MIKVLVMAIDDNDICRTFTFQNEEISVWTLDSMKDIGRVYTINTTIDLDSRIVEIPEESTIVFVGEGKFTHGTLISNKTKFVNLPRCDSNSYGGTKNTIGDNPSPFADIVGKIYNIYGQEITVRGDVIKRTTPVLYTHPIRENDLYKQPEILDKTVKRARNVGLTDCIMQFGVFGTSLSDAYVTGGWLENSDVHRNTPAHVAMEAFVNGLNVKAIKFHSNYWKGTVDAYCNFVKSYTESLITEFGNLNLPLFTDVYIANERGDWTSKYSRHASELKNLAIYLIAHCGIVPRISFAGIQQLAQADPCLHNSIKPGLNTYPSLTFLDDYLEAVLNGHTGYSDDLNLRIKQRIEQQFEATMIEHFPKDAYYWCSENNKVCNLPISEIGVRPYMKALRAPERYDKNLLGDFYKVVMPIYWKTIKKLAFYMDFEYIDFYYSYEIFDNDSNPANSNDDRYDTGLCDELYNILIDF